MLSNNAGFTALSSWINPLLTSALARSELPFVPSLSSLIIIVLSLTLSLKTSPKISSALSTAKLAPSPSQYDFLYGDVHVRLNLDRYIKAKSSYSAFFKGPGTINFASK